METVKFNPNLEDIEKRSKIQPYGKASKLNPSDIVPISFILYTTKQEIKQEQEETLGIYKLPVGVQTTMVSSISNEVSVKITNIPLNITHPQLLEIIFKKIKEGEEKPNNFTRPFTRLNLVFDKEKKISRGIAYANCENLEKAKTLAKTIRSIVIDACVLGAEVIE